MAEVVIDEGVWIKGLKGEKDPGKVQPPGEDTEIDPEWGLSAAILTAVQKDHQWVLTNEIIGIYANRIYEAAYRGPLWMRLRGSYLGVLVDSQRHHKLNPDPPPVIKPDDLYHHKDQCWVSAAAAAAEGCLLITVDGRLVAQLNASELPEVHHFEPMLVVGAAEALGIA